MEVDHDRFIGRKQALERLLVQCVRVQSRFTQDEEVADVDHSDAKPGISQEGSSGNRFESDFNTAPNEHDVRVDSVVGRESLPDRGAGNTVLLSLDIRHQYESLIVDRLTSGLTSSTESQTPVGFLDPTIKLMLFLARRQWSIVLTLLLASAGK